MTPMDGIAPAFFTSTTVIPAKAGIQTVIVLLRGPNPGLPPSRERRFFFDTLSGAR
jgi:hypothetical protein